MSKVNQIFQKLWDDYTKQNPSVKDVYDLFISHKQKVVNDHIAYRTFNHPKINVDVLGQWFINAGYECKVEYQFEQKHLKAKHYEHKTDKEAPRVFISELITEDFSPFLQEKANEFVDAVSNDLLNSENILYSGSVLKKPSFKVYNQLREESEYAAWLYVYGFRANHFTVSINHLQDFESIQGVNQLLKDNGFKLNTSGGEIKGSPQELLEQSSTIAGAIKYEFEEGIYEIPSCFYEFAKRYKDADGQLFSGFIAKSADKIFESTNFYK
jgi:hypothetical protein